MQGLTKAQVEQYLEEGYLMVPDVFAPEDIQPLRDELTEVIHDKALRLKAEGKLSRLYEEEPFERRLTRVFREAPEIVGAIMGKGGGGHSGPAFFDFVRNPKILAKIESLVGEEIVGSSVYRIRPKIPEWKRGAVPWHQDSGYFSPHCDGQLIVTCWIPLVDATPENGCLRVLPRCHRRGVSRHHTNGPGGYLVITDPDLPPAEPVTVPVPAGGVLFLTNLTPHSSTQHSVDIVRWAVDGPLPVGEGAQQRRRAAREFRPRQTGRADRLLPARGRLRPPEPDRPRIGGDRVAGVQRDPAALRNPQAPRSQAGVEAGRAPVGPRLMEAEQAAPRGWKQILICVRCLNLRQPMPAKLTQGTRLPPP